MGPLFFIFVLQLALVELVLLLVFCDVVLRFVLLLFLIVAQCMLVRLLRIVFRSLRVVAVFALVLCLGTSCIACLLAFCVLLLVERRVFAP